MSHPRRGSKKPPFVSSPLACLPSWLPASPELKPVALFGDPHPPRRICFLPWRVRWGHVRRLVVATILLCLLATPLKSGTVGQYLSDRYEWASRLVEWDDPAPHPLLTWGQNLSASALVANLTIPSSPPSALRAGSFPTYSAIIEEFVDVVLPPQLQAESRIQRYGGSPLGWDAAGRRTIWQTDKDLSAIKTGAVRSWRQGAASAEGWEWELLTDKTAAVWIKERLAGTRLELIWDSLPCGIMRADFLRYLLLTIHGGIYTDTDTILLRPPSLWGRGADLWKGGEGWIEPADKLRLESLGDINVEEKDAEVDKVLGRPSVLIGIEADGGDMEDWEGKWARPLQIAQWTMALSPFHPIALSALLRILHNTAKAITFAQSHHANYTSALSSDHSEARRLGGIHVLSDPAEGGPLGVMEWTGPAVWTDAVLEYLGARYKVTWEDLKELKRPLRIGDVVLLPVTGFSPGVGNFGAGEVWSDGGAQVQGILER